MDIASLVSSAPGPSWQQDSISKSLSEQAANLVNKQVGEGRVVKQQLGKDDFLKILITQLSHQDPTKPMEDREFISQMAQFSALEQMTNMSTGVADLRGVLSSGQALGTLGKSVEISAGGASFNGKVDGVTTGQYPQVLVNGTYYDYAQVKKINLEE